VGALVDVVAGLEEALRGISGFCGCWVGGYPEMLDCFFVIFLNGSDEDVVAHVYFVGECLLFNNGVFIKKLLEISGLPLRKRGTDVGLGRELLFAPELSTTFSGGRTFIP